MSGQGSAAASALVQSTLLGELLEQANIGAVAIDSGRYVAANEYACELTGYQRSELIGRAVREFDISAGSDGDHGVSSIRCKDDGEIDIAYRSVSSSLAGFSVRLCLFWPV